LGVSRSRLATRLERAARICLDSSILIYHLEEVEPYVGLTEEIVARVAAGQLEAVISAATVTELLVKPFADGRADRVAECEAFLHSFPNLRILPLEERTAREAARLRGQYHLKTPDSLIAASGLDASADTLITNDSAWDRLKAEGLTVINLESFLKK
jgi:predicted nucleic acid-binding protein